MELDKEEMQMIALQDLTLGQDLTSKVPPLTHALSDTHLTTHCSSCFSPLPSQPSTPSLHHCSPQCSLTLTLTLTAELHLLRHPSSADLRAALRLIATIPSLPGQRIHNLLTNHVTLTCDDTKRGAEAITEAMRVGGLGDCDVMLAECALCLVVTNSVDVVDFNGFAVGVAVYDVGFSWINHSCSPNAVYRFLFRSSPGFEEESGFRIGPSTGIAGCGGGRMENDNPSISKGCGEYGPRIVVRSVKVIKKGEEVTVAYTDLLQPKEARQSHLWSKFRFICQCTRCITSTYVDCSLQEIFVPDLDLSNQTPDLNLWKEMAAEKFSDYFEDVIVDYLSAGHPQSCCHKLENMLTNGLCVEQLEIKEGLSKPNFRLHPLHHHSLNAYTALASAYKVRASDLLAHCSEICRDQLEAFSMSRTSAAYSLMLAGSTHHLFCSEPSIIVSAANFWINAGESLLSLVKSSMWTLFGIPASDLSSITKQKCCNCSLMDTFDSFEADFVCNRVQNADFDCISSKFLDCVSNNSKKVWSFLCHGCHCLSMYEDPIDYSWAKTRGTARSWNSKSHSELNDGDSHCYDIDCISPREAQIYPSQERFNIYQLALHSLLYGGYLASICYGPKSHIKCRIENILFTNVKTCSLMDMMR